MKRSVGVLLSLLLLAVLLLAQPQAAARAASAGVGQSPRLAAFAHSRARTGQASCAIAPSTDPLTVPTENGAVRGMQEGSVLAFEGIPYAAPPVGDLRWRDPAPHDCWDGVLPATSFGNICPQISNGAVVGDEDCLTLNIWTPPAAAASGPLPVMFFIHGGGNTEGSSADKVNGVYEYDGAPLAQKGSAVVVTINYRLGVFGFLAHPALTAEPGQTTHGNYGIMDQIAALQWVQQNISGFGGDPSRVMIFGQSAGANDVCALVASPLAAGLFSRALMESAICTAQTLSQHESTGTTLAQKLGCDTAPDVLACLRGLPANTLVAAIPVDIGSSLASRTAEAYGIAVDGVLLTDQPQNVISAGGGNAVPLVVGSNANEMGLFFTQAISADQYASNVRAAYPKNAEAILAQYPVSAYASPRAAWVAVQSDAIYICPSRTQARAAAAGLGAPVFRYFFTHALEGGPAKPLGAFHSLELRFIFGHLDSFLNYTPSADEMALSDTLIGYWSRFAATGDPNGAGAPQWPAYDPATDSYLKLDTTSAAAQGVNSANCNFWDSLSGR